MNEASGGPEIGVIGIGNLLLGDEGMGVHAVRALSGAGPIRGVKLIDGGTDPWGALSAAEKCSALLLLDAVAAGKQPGELHRLDLDEVETGDVLMSLHGLSMFHLLQYERLCGNRFEEVVVLGMEPLKVEPGIGLSGLCRERMPALLDLVRDEIHSVRERMSLQGGKVNAGY